ncbi:hypothetical protein IWQ61_003470 [Dispira simplex]|nr:hypothetical protein IWQ61_003470 [Dispira simplex]
MTHFFKSAAAFYAQSARTHPIVTLSLTNAALCAASDMVAQWVSSKAAHTHTYPVTIRRDGDELEEAVPLLPNQAGLSPTPHTTQPLDTTVYTNQQGFTLQMDRVLRFASFGFCNAPLLYMWYTFLDRRFPLPTTNIAATTSPTLFQSSTLWAVAKRVLCDQIFYAPIGISIFFIFITVMEGGRQKEIREKFTSHYISAMTANYKVWPLVQSVNFFFVPLSLQVPFASTVSFFWNSYLSWLNSSRTGLMAEESNPLGG